MKRISFTAFLFIVLSSGLFSSCGDNFLTYKKYHLSRVTEAVDSVRHALEVKLNKKIPTLNIFMQTPDDTLFVSSRDSGTISLTKETFFRFAENTMNFTATAILNMHEEGWLNINSVITDIIPGSNTTYVPDTITWNIPNKNQITIKQLLQHSAGVYDVTNDTVPGFGGQSYVNYKLGIEPGHQFSATELVNQISINNLSYFSPGASFHLSQTGFTILGELIARVYSFHKGVNKFYSNYINDYIIGPSSLISISAAFPHGASDVSLPFPFASGKAVTNSGTITYANLNMSAYVAGANGFSTFQGLNLYIRTLFNGTNVLSPESLQLMKYDIAPGNNSYGLGCFNLTNLGFGHFGAENGYISYMLYNPSDGVSLVIMMPFIDFTSNQNYNDCIQALTDAGYASRSMLGYPGKP